MNRTSRTRALLPLALAAALIQFLPRANAQVGAGESGISFGLAISTDLKTDAEVYYLVGEPVYLKFRLTNWSSDSVAIALNTMLQSDIKLEARVPQTRFEEIPAPFPQAPVETGQRVLRPFDSYSFGVKLLYDRLKTALPSLILRGKPSGPYEQANPDDKDTFIRIIGRPHLVFDHESHYQLRAAVSVTVNRTQKLPIQTAPLDVHFKMPEPGSPEDNFLGKMTWNVDNVIAFQRGIAEGKVLKFFEESFKNDPPNRYTPHILYLLGRSYSSSKPESQDQAIAYYEQLIAGYPAFAQLHEAEEQLAMLHLRRGEADKGYTVFQRLMNEDPDYFRGQEKSMLTRAYLGTDPEEYNPMMWTLTP